MDNKELYENWDTDALESKYISDVTLLGSMQQVQRDMVLQTESLMQQIEKHDDMIDECLDKLDVMKEILETRGFDSA